MHKKFHRINKTFSYVCEENNYAKKSNWFSPIVQVNCELIEALWLLDIFVLLTLTDMLYIHIIRKLIMQRSSKGNANQLSITLSYIELNSKLVE